MAVIRFRDGTVLTHSAFQRETIDNTVYLSEETMRNDLEHSSGPWKDHKYVRKDGDRYIYSDSKGRDDGFERRKRKRKADSDEKGKKRAIEDAITRTKTREKIGEVLGMVSVKAKEMKIKKRKRDGEEAAEAAIERVRSREKAVENAIKSSRNKEKTREVLAELKTKKIERDEKKKKDFAERAWARAKTVSRR